MKTMAFLVVAALANGAWAALPASTCDKIDYAEAKDWSIPQLEKQYCEDMRIEKATSTSLRKTGSA